jgi:predicted phage-related endonuclease
VSIDAVSYSDERDWIDARWISIGASEVPALLGVCAERMDPSSVRARLITEKVTRERKAPDTTQRRRREAGRVIEAFGLARLAQKLQGRKKSPVLVVPCGFTIYRNTEFPGLHATPDGWVIERVVGAECKAIGPDALLEWGAFDGYQGRWKWADEPPLRHVLQCQAQMAATGAQQIWLVAVAGTDTHFYAVLRDESLIRHIGREVAKAIVEITELRTQHLAAKESA